MRKLGKNALANLTLDTSCQIDLGSNVTAVDNSNYNTKILWGVNHDNQIVNDTEFREQKYTITDSEGIKTPNNDGVTGINYTKITGDTVILQAYKQIDNGKIIPCKAYYPTENFTGHSVELLTDEEKNARQKIKNIFIPYGVAKLVNEVFTFVQAKNVTIPSSVTNIGVQTFRDCTALEDIEIPNEVKQIESKAFWGCVNLKAVKIPAEMTEIGGYTFYKCSSLKSVTMPNSVTTIRDSAFAYCTALENVEIPNSVTTIGRSVFSNTGLKSVTIPSSVTGIGANTFYNCNNLTIITINKEANSIEGSPWGATGAEIIWEE